VSALALRDRRALWLGAILVLPAITWRAVVAPIASVSSSNTVRAELTAGLLSREMALIRDGARLSAALGIARTRLRDESSSLFAASDTAGATSALASWLRAAARATELTEVRVEGAPVLQGAGEFMTVQADLRASGSTAALAAWLARVEGGERVLSVDRLDISTNGDGVLLISARVRGFARRSAP
jgi:type II secretory pathway component PulM